MINGSDESNGSEGLLGAAEVEALDELCQELGVVGIADLPPVVHQQQTLQQVELGSAQSYFLGSPQSLLETL